MPYQLLFADDSATMHRVVQITFAREDFAITSVNNGPAAIAKAKEMKPDVAVIDISMPGMDGYAVCQSLKSDPATAQIPVLLLAGSQEPYDEGKAQASGANSHVVKPFDTQTLLDKVKTLVGAPLTSTTAARPAAAVPPPVAPPPVAKPAAPPPTPAAAPRPASAAPLPPSSAAPTSPAPPAWPTTPGSGAPRPPGAPVVPSAAPAAPAVPLAAAAPSHPVVPPPTPVAAAPAGVPMAPPVPKPVAPPPTPAVAAAAPLPKPVTPPPVAQAAPVVASVAKAAAGPVAQGVADIIGAAGLSGQVDTNALMTMAREVIERVAWEVVPPLAETLLREQMDRMAKN